MTPLKKRLIATSQQIGDEALAIYQANKDDQVRMDSLLRSYFAQVRADEFEAQLVAVSKEMSCVDTSVPAITS